MFGMARVSDYMRINLLEFGVYSFSVDVAKVLLVFLICSKLKDKLLYWVSQLWSFHVRIKVVQCIMHDSHVLVLFYHNSLGLRSHCKHCCNIFGLCCRL